MRLLDRISAFINAESLLTQGSRVIVGLSGGADSVALLALLRALGHECIAVHCHFGLRGNESDRDAAHAKMIANRLGAQFVEIRFNTLAYMRRHSISAEMACRDLRYAEFEKLRFSHGAEAIAVGHHREDNIETMLLNMLRGSGIHGIKGMDPKRGHIVRPLLETSRNEILAYLSVNELPYIVDSSNLQNDYKRNKLRNLIIPMIMEVFPDAQKTLGQTLRNLRNCDALYRKLLPERTDSLIGVDATLLHEWLAPFGFNSSQCRNILRAETGAEFRSDTHILTICPGKRYELTEVACEVIKPRLVCRTLPADGPFKPQRGHLYVDADSIPSLNDLHLRLWQEGDKIRPFGMTGYRFVSDVMRDCGICSTRRRHTWLLCHNDEVLWIVGHRASNHFKVTPDTKNIIEIYIDHENI